MRPNCVSTAAAIGAVFLLPHVLAAQTTVRPPEIPLKDVLVIRSVARPGRSVVHLDAVEARIVAGQWRAPREGDVVSGARGADQHWEAAKANDQGSLGGSVARGGYVYVNGEIRGGDSYGNGYLRLPVLLQKGTNDFLVQSGRGDLRAKLISSPELLSIHTADSTLPDIITGENEPVWGATVLLNATTNFMRVSLRALERGSPQNTVSIPPLGIYKAPFLFRPPRFKQGTNTCSVALEAVDRSGPKHSRVRARVSLRVRRPDQTCKRSFLSEIDDSVQYYAVNPAASRRNLETAPALFLSLHGAGVEAVGQADSYYPKKWGHIVCPTNRRPYGFDWEEWGRWDALEVLALAKARYRPDPGRIYLTGHSMGGHGTWQLGALFPDQFAAIGSSAGWISFGSYANPSRSPVTNDMQRMLLRAAAASDTLLMATNYLQEGVYILHGSADDNVPVAEAREMRRVLGEFHRDFDFHEQAGAGHWWDASDEPGTDCVDWAPMFDFFAHHTIPADESLRRVRFVTVNPAVSSRSHWVSVLAQQRQLEPSAVDVRCDPGRRRVVGVTTNVSRLWLDFPTIKPGPGLTIELDGQKLEGIELPNPNDCGVAAAAFPGLVPGLCLARAAGQWQLADYPSSALKRPDRSGPFREAFRNHVALVYATKGTPEENAWTLAKARYDAETFYYRGNGSIELMADVDVLVSEGRRKHSGRGQRASRNLIVYGHAECNAAWGYLLGKSPVQAHRSRLRVGDHELAGEDLGWLFLQPNPHDEKALVGVVGGSGMTGMRVTERMPYFLSGAGFPDCLIIGAELPAQGIDGVRAAGFLGEDWQVGTGEFVWRE
ncbi:MAG TPA: prolyl oligopeptidase family serine peptidase [Verrucomicrobiae bacterium]